MGKECGSYLKSEGIGVASLVCGTEACPLKSGRLLYVDDKSGLLTPADLRRSIQKRASVITGMVCVAGDTARVPDYSPNYSEMQTAPKVR